jgi:hypothetical protein
MQDNEEDIETVDKERKSRSLALTHVAQGGPANKRSKPLLLKSDASNVTEDVYKSLEQVNVKLSMQEFLQKFFNMYETDAVKLAKVFGYCTDLDEEISKVGHDRWLEEYLEKVEDEVSRIDLIVAANTDGEDTMQMLDKCKLLEIRKAFEEGLEKVSQCTDPYKENSDVVSEEDTQGGSASNINKGDGEMTDKDKNAELEKANARIAELEKAAERLKELEKAENERLEKGYKELVKSYSYVPEDKQEAVVKLMLKSAEDAQVLDLVLKAAQEEVKKSQDELEKIKDEFGKVKTLDGDLTQTSKQSVEKSLKDFQDSVKNLAR